MGTLLWDVILMLWVRGRLSITYRCLVEHRTTLLRDAPLRVVHWGTSTAVLSIREVCLFDHHLFLPRLIKVFPIEGAHLASLPRALQICITRMTDLFIECFCGDRIVNAQTLVNGSSPDDGCNMPCRGNVSEYCGGANKINIYQRYHTPSLASTHDVI